MSLFRPLAVVLVACATCAASVAHAGAPKYIPPVHDDAPSQAAPAPATPAPAAAPAPQRFRLLVLDLKGNDVDANTVKTLQGIVTAGLAEYPELDVVSGDDVKNLVQLQAERQTMGCSEDASCMAEIADALGAQLVVFGTAGKLDNSLVVNLNLFDSVKAMGLGRIVVQTEDTKSLPKKLRPKLRDLVGRFYKERGIELPPPVVEKEEAPVARASDPGPWPWITAGTGAVLLVGGAVSAVVGYLPLATFQEQKAAVTTAQKAFAKDGDLAHVDTARAAQVKMLDARDSWNNLGVYLFDVGVPAAAVGLVAGAAGLVWALTTPGEEPAAPPPPSPAAAPVAGAAR
jgi:hypothetical protein